MHATIFSGTIFGVDGLTVEVEVDIARGIPSFSIVGLPNAAVRESRERVTAAIKNSGREFPLERITVNLAPADIKKEGATFDLAIATGILIAASKKKSHGALGGLSRTLFVGELALNGDIRKVRGVLPVLLHAKVMGFQRAVIPYDNYAESLVVGGVEVFAAKRLVDVVELLDDGIEQAAISPDHMAHKSTQYVRDFARTPSLKDHDGLDMEDVVGQETAKRALLVAAAGGHHVLMMGPPGAGKTMLARRFPSILPSLGEDAAIETTRIYSIAGLLDGHGLVTTSPFRSPHHSASDAGLIGGGNVPRPGEVTLAHNGVLFLDELPEFKRHVLETLRQPLEDGRIAISRARSTVAFPARFQMIAAMNPCPCGHLGSNDRECYCTPAQRERYLAKLSGPLLDRISIHFFVRSVETTAFDAKKRREGSRLMLRAVIRARARQARRIAQRGPDTLNARLAERELRRFCALEKREREFLHAAQRKLQISARGRSHILRVARTIADLAGEDVISTDHIGEAVQYRIRSNAPSE